MTPYWADYAYDDEYDYNGYDSYAHSGYSYGSTYATYTKRNRWEPQYDYEVWAETKPGVWTRTYTGNDLNAALRSMDYWEDTREVDVDFVDNLALKENALDYAFLCFDKLLECVYEDIEKIEIPSAAISQFKIRRARAFLEGDVDSLTEVDWNVRI
jgi:hypothetical protein